LILILFFRKIVFDIKKNTILEILGLKFVLMLKNIFLSKNININKKEKKSLMK
jgi:hypothetical protein